MNIKGLSIIPGDKIQIYKKQQISTSEKYKSQVEEVLADDVVKISTPIKEHKVIPLHLQDYIFEFFTKNGIYRGIGTIIERGKENNFYYLIAKFKNDFRKVQRRKYFRLDCLLPFEFKKETEDDFELDFSIEKMNESNEPDVLQDEGYTNDISAGGIRFVAKSRLENQDEISVTILLPFHEGEKTLQLKAIVLDREIVADFPVKYSYRAEFLDIEEQTREEIIRFIFQQQIKQKGK